MQGNRLFWIIPGIAVGAAFLWFSMRSVELASGLLVARHAEVAFVCLAIVASMAFLVFKSWRWRVLVVPFAQVRARDLLPAVCAGTFVNLTASHAGEVARALLVSRREGVSTSALLGSIVIERLLDMSAVLALVGVLALRPSDLPVVVVTAGYMAATLLVAVCTLVFVGIRWTAASLRLMRVLLGWLPRRWNDKIVGHFGAAVGGLKVLKDAHMLRRAGLLSLLQWGSIVVAIYACVRSLGVTAGAVASVAVLLMLVVGLTLPSAPANVGTTQMGFSVGLGAFEIGMDHAFAASVIYTLFVLLPMMLVGLGCLLYMRTTLSVSPSRAGDRTT